MEINTLLNKQGAKEESKRKVRNYFEISKQNHDIQKLMGCSKIGAEI